MHYKEGSYSCHNYSADREGARKCGISFINRNMRGVTAPKGERALIMTAIL